MSDDKSKPRMVSLADIGLEEEEEDSSSSEEASNIDEATESSLSSSCAPMTQKVLMVRAVTRKATKRAKPATGGKRRQSAKKAKISPVVPSPPQSESPPSLTSDTSPPQKADSVVPSGSFDNHFVGEQPKMPDFVKVDSLLIHEDTFEGEKSIPCFCQLPRVPPEGYKGCEEGCVNRASKVECGSRCPTGQYCHNKLFQKKEYAPVEAFYCGPNKGWGVRAVEEIQEGTFVMEYVGELIGELEYYRRRWLYGQDKEHRHHYFMMAGQGDVIDATKYGSISRFINHSCNPNCETAKWMVKKRSRIGFFAKRLIKKGEEIVFNYQFRSVGAPQRCFCGAANCQGVIGSQQAARAERESDSDSDIDFAELEPTKVVAGGVAQAEKEKPKKKKIIKRKKKDLDRKKSTRQSMEFAEVTAEELDEFAESGCRLRNGEHITAAVRLMLRLENTEDRIRFLKAILENNSEASNLWRLFIENEVLSILYMWFHPDAIQDSEYLLKLVAFASLVPLTEQKQVRESGLLERLDKILNDTQEDIIQDVVDNLLSEVCADGMECVRRQSRVNLAVLFGKWSKLKVFNKIPKKERVENKPECQVEDIKKPEYEMRSILRPSYVENGSHHYSNSISSRVSTLRNHSENLNGQRFAKHRDNHINYNNYNNNNNNESSPNVLDDEEEDDDASTEEDIIPFRSVIGYVNMKTLNLLEVPPRPKCGAPGQHFYKDNSIRNQTLFNDEQTEFVSPTPLAVGPHTPSEPPANEDLNERDKDFTMGQFSPSIRRIRTKRKSRFDLTDDNKGSPALPQPKLIAPSTCAFNLISIPTSSTVPSPSPSMSAPSFNQKHLFARLPNPSFPPPAIPIVYPPPVINPMMPMTAPPLNLEAARQQLVLYKAHVAYLSAYIEQQEAAIRSPAKDLDSRLSEFIFDVNLPKSDPQETEKVEEVPSSAMASCSSQSQELLVTPTQVKSFSKAKDPTSTEPPFSLEVRAKFKTDIVKFVQSLLEPYRKRCFKSSEDFKHLTRKLTHTILEKEEKNSEDLRVSEGVKKKAKDYVMSHVKKFEKGQYEREKPKHKA